MNALRTIREYSLASYHGAGGRLGRLLPVVIRLASARFRYSIGPFPFSLFGLAHVPMANWSGYLVREERVRQVLRRASPHRMHRLARNKILFYEYCRRAGLPTIPVICRVGGTPDPLTEVVERIANADRFAALLESAPPRLFVKCIAGAHGRDAFLLCRQRGEFAFAGRTGDAGSAFAYIAKQCDERNGFMVQEQMRPHPEILPFASSNALPTMRVVTAIGSDGPKLLFACLKISVGTNIADNFDSGRIGNMLAAIDLESGELSAAYGSRCRDWPVIVKTELHPDSGHRITGTRLPFWQKIVDLALRGQESLPELMTIGWDVAVTLKGVVIVEANSEYGMNILQVAYQRGLKAELSDALGIMLD